MAELKPCPFCGGERVEVLNALEAQPEMELIGMSRDNWNVLCNDCFALGGTRRKALEAIEAWNQRKPRWISVEERLPEKQADVLMLFEHNMAVGFWHDGDEDVTFWCAYTDDGFYTDCDVSPTHGMLLPEPPEVDTP